MNCATDKGKNSTGDKKFLCLCQSESSGPITEPHLKRRYRAVKYNVVSLRGKTFVSAHKRVFFAHKHALSKSKVFRSSPLGDVLMRAIKSGSLRNIRDCR